MSDWIEWSGKTRPVDAHTVVQVRFRGGDTDTGEAGTWSLCWVTGDDADDIVAYRVIGTNPIQDLVTCAEEKHNPANPFAVQVAGDHYKKLKIQPIEFIHANGIPFAEGSVIKYVTRWRDKGGIKDLEKARHFLDLLIDLERKAKE